MNKRSIVAGAAAALLIVGTGGAAIGANLALLGTERDASNVGQLEIVTARAELDTDTTVTDGTAAVPAVATTDGITAEQAVAISAAEVGGTLLEVEWTTERGRSVFEVERRLDDGRRVEVYVDAADGTVLEVEVQGRASTAPAPSAGPAIGTERAVEIAVVEVGGTLVEVERDREGGVDLYGVYLRQADGSVLDVHIDAVTGAVLRIEQERPATSSSGSGSGSATPAPAPAPSGTDIGADRAVEIAIAQVGGTLVDVEPAREDGILVWDVELRQADGRILGVDVDRSTGAVLRVETEDDDSDDDWDDDSDDDWDDDDD